MAIIKFVYHALALDCLALVNSLRFELNVNRDSFCNAHFNDTVCMYPVMSLHMVTMMLRPSGASSCAYLLKLVAIPPRIVNGCPAKSVFDTRTPPVQTKYSPMAKEAMPTSQQKARPPMQSLFERRPTSKCGSSSD